MWPFLFTQNLTISRESHDREAWGAGMALTTLGSFLFWEVQDVEKKEKGTSDQK